MIATESLTTSNQQHHVNEDDNEVSLSHLSDMCSLFLFCILQIPNQLFFSALKTRFSAIRFLRRTGLSASEIIKIYEISVYFCAWHPLVLFLRTTLRGPRAEIILVFVVPPWRRAASASTMGCGGRMPTTQHIAATLTPWATRRYAGSRAFDHHSHSKLTLMVPHFFVTFFNGMIIDN